MARDITWRSDYYESDPVLSGTLYLDGVELGVKGIVESDPNYTVQHNWNQGSGVTSVLTNIINWGYEVVNSVNKFARSQVSGAGIDIGMGFGSKISKTDIGINYKEYGGTNYSYNVPEFKVFLLPKDDATNPSVTNTPLDQLNALMNLSSQEDLSKLGLNLKNAENEQEKVLAEDVQSQVDQLSKDGGADGNYIFGSQYTVGNTIFTLAPHNFERYIIHSPEKDTGFNSSIKGKCRLVVGGIKKHYYTNLLISNINIQYSKSRLYDYSENGVEDKGPAWITMVFQFEPDATDFKKTFIKHLLER